MDKSAMEIGELARELRRHISLLRSTGIHGLSTTHEPIFVEPLSRPATADRKIEHTEISAPTAVPEKEHSEKEAPPAFAQKLSEAPSTEKASASPREETRAQDMPPTPEVAPAPAAVPVLKAPVGRVTPEESHLDFESLEALQMHIGACTRCPLHSQGRQHIVFGEGNPQAEIMFVTQAPGAQEDKHGTPLVGKAGELLTKIIEGGMKRNRGEVYIANVIKCRPPQNRDPTPEEIATCRPFILQQIKQVKPRVIVTLGRVAAQALLQTERSITHMRGEWQELHGIPVMPTFHPDYLLRNPTGKREVWADIQEVLKVLSSPPQG